MHSLEGDQGGISFLNAGTLNARRSKWCTSLCRLSALAEKNHPLHVCLRVNRFLKLLVDCFGHQSSEVCPLFVCQLDLCNLTCKYCSLKYRGKQFIVGARNWTPVLGTQIVSWPLTCQYCVRGHHLDHPPQLCTRE